jgi:hypothetical protein
VASPFGRLAGKAALPGDEDAWSVGDGHDTKSPLWRLGCWLIGLAVFAVCLRCLVWLLGGSAPFELLVSGWLLVCLLAGALMTLPHGLSRLRGSDHYTPPRDALHLRPQGLLTVLFVMVFWRSLLTIGDSLMTLIWNSLGRRWLAAHKPPVVDPLEAEIQHSIEYDNRWWGQDS